MPRFDAEKIVNRYAESVGITPTKIYDEVVTAEKVLNVLRHEAELEHKKNIKDNFAIQVIEARIIGQLRHLAELKKKYGLK